MPTMTRPPNQASGRGTTRRPRTTVGTAGPSTPHLGNTAAPGFTPTQPSQPTAPPPDPTYEAYRLSAGRNIQLGNAEATYQRANIQNEFGIGDTSNPYSKAALLQESYNRSKRGTMNSFASQVYSGAYTNAQNENDRNYSISNDALQRSYSTAMHNIGVGQLQNYATNAIGVSDEGFNALLRSIGLG